TFTGARAATGGGLVLAAGGSGVPAPATFPHVAGSVSAVVPDGSGGWVVAGEVSAVGTVPAEQLAHITPAGEGDAAPRPSCDGTITALALAGSTLYVAGYFQRVNGAQRRHIAGLETLTGAVTPFKADPDGSVTSLAVSGTTLYAAGQFSTIAGANRANL